MDFGDDVTLLAGDCVEVLAGVPDGSVDAVVTDPPYGLEFMGKDWDRFAGQVSDRDFKGFVLSQQRTRNVKCPECGKWAYDHPGKLCECGGVRRAQGNAFQRWCEEWAGECLRVLKPGGHLLAFGGSRTFHRLACALEDAGFEIRDTISWLYGSGFPKSMDVSKAIDKHLGGERQVVGRRTDGRYAYAFDGTANRPTGAPAGSEDAERIGGFVSDKALVTAPATEEAAAWEGWGTALKPGWEPVVVARKPLAGTVAGNVLAHGVGGINVDGCRVPTGDPLGGGGQTKGHLMKDGWRRPWMDDPEAVAANAARSRESVARSEELGRWPANVLLGESAARDLDAQSGWQKSGTATAGSTGFRTEYVGGATKPGAPALPQPVEFDEGGGASRYFPQFEEPGRFPPNVVLDEAAAAGVDEQSGVTTNTRHMSYQRGGGEFVDGIASQPEQGWHVTETGGASRYFPTFRYQAKPGNAERPVVDGVMHPTVKPVDLMRWLVRLVCPKGGLVLDPFAGSGTTGEACLMEGMRCLLVEREPEYLRLIEARLSKGITPTLF